MNRRSAGDGPPSSTDGAMGHTPLAVDAGDASELCGISRSHWLRLVATERVPTGFYLGRRRLWDVNELQAWIAAGAPNTAQWKRLRGEPRR